MTSVRKILKGPSKYELSVSFFDMIRGERRPITFTLKFPDSPTEFNVIVNHVSWEDGSGDSWNIKGFIPGTCDIEGYYSTKHRTGQLTMISN